MKTNIRAAADALSNQDLLAHIDVLAGRERNTSVELVAHLVALATRPACTRPKASLFMGRSP